jgi:hypothetical protein
MRIKIQELLQTTLQTNCPARADSTNSGNSPIG